MCKSGVQVSGIALESVPTDERDDLRKHLLYIASEYDWVIEISAVQEQG